jgi:hypothetical protein
MVGGVEAADGTWIEAAPAMVERISHQESRFAGLLMREADHEHTISSMSKNK